MTNPETPAAQVRRGTYGPTHRSLPGPDRLPDIIML